MGKKPKSSERVETHHEDWPDQDEHFYFIAGYTEGGFPYGITWEEHEREQRREAARMTRRELKLSEAQMHELVGLYDTSAEDISFYLNADTGEIIMIHPFDRDEKDEDLEDLIDEDINVIYFKVPAKDSHEGYEDMLAFAETVTDERLWDRLMNALKGRKKVFRKFKDTLALHPDEAERYYRFVESRDRERVLGWLRSIGFEV